MLEHFRNRQIYFCFQNSIPYSADVKPTVNKNQFDFIHLLHVYTPISMYEINTLQQKQINRLIILKENRLNRLILVI